VSHVEQEVLSLSEYLSSHPMCIGVRVARSLVFYVMFCRPLFISCSFSFGHCIVCPSDYPFGVFKLFLDKSYVLFLFFFLLWFCSVLFCFVGLLFCFALLFIFLIFFLRSVSCSQHWLRIWIVHFLLLVLSVLTIINSITISDWYNGKA